ncbi:MAG TPA: hypothetical protein VF950_16385 [Planctomycetota bacterium]
MKRCFALLLLAGCDTFGSIRATGRPVAEAYAPPHELRVLDVDSPLRAEKRVPVLSTPEVFAAYVPTRVEGDRMIGEHWIFFRLRESEWFIERLQDPDPPADVDAPPESLKPLQELDWKKTLIPHR